MSIIRRGNSKYWYIQFQLNGRTYIKSSKTTVKKLAEQMESDWRSKLHAQQFLGHKERITIRKAIEQFCESRRGQPHHAPLLAYAKGVIRLLPVHKYFDELTSHDLERFKRDRTGEGVGPQTLKHSFNLIRGAWKYSKRLGFEVGELEFPQIKVPKSPLRYLTNDEEKRLLINLEPTRDIPRLPPWAERSAELKRTLQDAYDLVVILLDTGARYSEIAGIEWSRINLHDKTIRLWRPKVQNEGVLYMTNRVFAVLSRRDLDKTSPFVFRNRKGGPRGYVSHAIRKALRKAGLADCRIHTLRHTHASRLIQNGMSVYEVREILGHTDIKTTMRYAHLETQHVTSKARDVIDQLNKRAASASASASSAS